MNYRVVIFFLALLFSTCTPPVVFDEPYPLGSSDMSGIPKIYQGVFICESDSSMIIIRDKNVTLRKEHFFKMPLSKVDEREDCSIVGNQMYVKARAECIPLEFINDSTVRGTVIEHDTLFSMSDKSVARSYKGNIVFSQETKNNEWAISLISLEENGDIMYSAITDKSKINNIKKITPTKDITTELDKKPRFKIKPSMKEFDELLSDEKVFIECEYLTRVNLEDSFMYLY